MVLLLCGCYDFAQGRFEVGALRLACYERRSAIGALANKIILPYFVAFVNPFARFFCGGGVGRCLFYAVLDFAAVLGLGMDLRGAGGRRQIFAVRVVSSPKKVEIFTIGDKIVI